MLKHVLCREALIKNYVIFLTNFRIWRYNLGQLNERDVALLEDVQITATWIITGIRVSSRSIILCNELGWDASSHKLNHNFFKIF